MTAGSSVAGSTTLRSSVCRTKRFDGRRVNSHGATRAGQREGDVARRSGEAGGGDQGEAGDALGPRAGVFRCDETTERVSQQRECIQPQRGDGVVERRLEVREVVRRGRLLARAEAR